MRKSEATPGRVVYYGNRDDLRNGRDTSRVSKVIILAVGPYTEARDGCESRTIAVHAPEVISTDRVVIAEGHWVDADGYSTAHLDLAPKYRPIVDRNSFGKVVRVWTVRVLGSFQNLMTEEEFDIKATGYRLAKDEWDTYQSKGEELEGRLNLATEAHAEDFAQGAEIHSARFKQGGVESDSFYVTLEVPMEHFDALPYDIQEAIRLLSDHQSNPPKCDHPSWRRRVRRR